MGLPFFFDPAPELQHRSTYQDADGWRAPVDLSDFRTVMRVYLGGAPAWGTRLAEASFKGKIAAAVHWSRVALRPAEVAVLFRMTAASAWLAGDATTASSWLAAEPSVPCLAATAAPDFARGYGGATDAATWVVGETVHEMVCGAKGTAATFYTSDTLPGDVSLSADGHLQGSMGDVASTTSVGVHASNTAGRASAVLSLGTRLAPPDISAGYAPAGGGAWPNYYASNEVIALEVTNTGGVATSFNASDLVTGLAVDPANGAINGTITTVGTHTFTVTASSAAGSSTTRVELVTTLTLPLSTFPPTPPHLHPTYNQVVTQHVLPELSDYSLGNKMSFPRTVAITARTVTELDGRACTFSIVPALPAGLSLDSTNGTISGTPSVEIAERIYFVTAELTADSTAQTFSQVEIRLAVTAIPPTNLTSTAISLNLTLNAPMPNVTFTADGDPVSYALRSASGECARLVAVGLLIDQQTGVLSGTPRNAIDCPLVVEASNTGGAFRVAVPLVVAAAVDGSVHLGLEIELSTLQVSSSTQLAQLASFSDVFARDVAAALGLVMSAPTGPQAQLGFQDVQPGGGTAGRGLVLFTLKPGGIASPRELEHKLSVLAADRTSDLFHGVYTRAVVATTGLVAYAADGTPRLAGDVAPSFLTGYPDSGHLIAYYNVSLTTGGTGTAPPPAMTPQAVNGTAVTFEVFPLADLPAGLLFDTNTGAFEGTPTTVQEAAKTFTVIASNPAGNTSTTVSLRVLETPPRLYLPAALSGTHHLLRSKPARLAVPGNSGGDRNLAFSSDPALPAGLLINISTGEIAGTPSLAAASANYTITARSTGGNSSIAVRFRVHGHPTLVATGTAAASALCGPTTGATSLNLETSFPLTNLSVGDNSTVRCRFEAAEAGADVDVFAVVITLAGDTLTMPGSDASSGNSYASMNTSSSTLRCTSPSVSAAVRAPLKLSFSEGVDFVPVDEAGAVSSFAYYLQPANVYNGTEPAAMLTGSSDAVTLQVSKLVTK